ncbi:MAG: anaerobic ribonucleoside-triphosphate reductase activating protein [Clostridiales bacterium]|nr:anaerobic ribonucleoside-triphosphate reductase activating protein [Clostridiales bacterium]
MRDKATITIAGIVRESITDGPGIRFTVFAQGCPHHCEGCHNPQTWPFTGGTPVTVKTIIAKMKADPLLRGITLSGGEPFCQAAPMVALAKAAKAEGYDVVVYTGYTFEELLRMGERDQSVIDLLKQTDILVDGPFIKEKKSYDLRFRGSANQRIIDVPKSLKSKRIVDANI